MKLSYKFSKVVEKILKYEGEDKKQIALKNYIKLILVMARKYTRPRVDYEDVVMEGVRGLLEAVEDFDETRSKDFKTYAIMRMKGRMYLFCITQRKPVHVPTHIAMASTHVEKMLSILDKENYLYEKQILPIDIIKVFTHYEEENLSGQAKKSIRAIKDKINNLASNSMTSYESLVLHAIVGLVQETDILEGTEKPHEENQKMDAELIMVFNECEEEIEKIIGEKRTFILKLKVSGYNYLEIAKKLFRYGYTDRIISRQAIKNSIERSKRVLKEYLI